MTTDQSSHLPVEVEDPSVSSYQPMENRPLSKAEAGVLGLLVVAAAGFVGFLFRLEMKEQKKREERELELEKEQAEREKEAQAKREEFDQWVTDQQSNGKVVVHFRVGDRIAIPVDTYKDVEVRRLPGMRD